MDLSGRQRIFHDKRGKGELETKIPFEPYKFIPEPFFFCAASFGAIATMHWEKCRKFAQDHPLAATVASTILVFFALLIANFQHLETPYYWDGVGYIFPHSVTISRSGFNPILMDYDVGHPTAFYFLSAIAMKIFGVGPVGVRLLVWIFAAALLTATYKLSRAAGTPILPSAACCVAIYAFPLFHAQLLQIQLDLPLASMILCSYYCFLRRLWIGWFLFGSLACLIKLYGFLFIFPATATCLLLGYLREKRLNVREAMLSLTPLVTFGAFLCIRHLVRGPGLTVNHTTGNTLLMFWKWKEFSEYGPFAWSILFSTARITNLLVASAFLACAAIFRRGRGAITPGMEQILVIFGLFILGWNFMFIQMRGLCPRYNLILVPMLMIVSTFFLSKLIKREAAQVALILLFVPIFFLQWHPRNVKFLPKSIQSLIILEYDYGYKMEANLQFLDYTRLSQWGARRVVELATEEGAAVNVATPWPDSQAWSEPGYGYAAEQVPTVYTGGWREIDASATPYVFFADPIWTDSPEPPQELFKSSKLLDDKTINGIKGRIYRLEPPSS